MTSGASTGDWDLLSFSFDSFHREWYQTPDKAVFVPEILSTSFHETGITPEIKQAKAADNSENSDQTPDYAAQSKVFAMLQEAQELERFGGIFVARFDMAKLDKKIKGLKEDLDGQKKLLEQWRKWVIKIGGKTAEENILVLHPQLGIILLAVPSHYGSEKFQEQYNTAKEAVDNCEKILLHLFRMLACEKTCYVEINGIVCLPDASVENNEALPHHIYKNTFEDIQHFATFWSDRIEASIKEHGKRNYSENPSFQQFARFIVSYRSSATVSTALNAHEVYRHLAMATLSEEERGNKSVFSLNPRQLSSYLSTNKHQILFGLPGTGKTLLLMLLATRAKTVHEKIPGKVAILTGGKRLIKKYENCLQSVHSNRKQTVRDNLKLEEISDDDDFFTDEMQSIAGDWLQFLKQRSKLNHVYTVVAVSGRAWATDVDANMASTMEKPELQGYFFLNLTTVVRGTKHIVEYWSNKFLPLVPPIGHRNEGEAVIEEVQGTTDGILVRVKHHIQDFLAAKFTPSDIAILTFNKWAADDIKKYLKDQEIKACSAKEAQQMTPMEYRNHVQIDFNNNVLSQEYSAVIVVNYYGYMGTSESTEFTALTRAIARLVVLKKDRMIMQRQIDEIMEQQKNQNVDMVKIVKAAAEALSARELSAIEWKDSLKAPIADWKREHEAANNWDQYLAELRYNILPAGLKDNEHFKQCTKFSDVFRILIENERAMHDYLKTHVPEDHPFYPYKQAHGRLQLFDLEGALGPKHLDLKDEEMREILLCFNKHYLTSLDGFLKHTSIKDRQENHFHLADLPKWQAITRTMFTLG